MSEDANHILVIEDDTVLGGALRQRLMLEGFDVTWAKNCKEAIVEIKRKRPAYILSDIVLPDGSGEDLFCKVQPWLGDTPILFATAYGEIDQAVRLVKAGAEDYLTKPYDADLLIERVRKTIAARGMARGNKSLPNMDGVILPSTGALIDKLQRAGQADLPVLLTGETGVGKEVAARYLHSVSERRSAPFVAVNCAAIPHELLESQFFGHMKGAFTGANETHMGFFEEAGGGTLFLDEIGDLAARLQAALLRVLEDGRFRPLGSRKEKQFKGRIIAATNADLAQLRRERAFRDDLYYRLAVLEIEIEPLRERKGEIIGLATTFLADGNAGAVKRHQLSDSARQALFNHDWPGNIRELRNRLQRACVFADSNELQPEDVFPEIRLVQSDQTLADARRRAEAELIEKALEASGGKVAEAAKSLGISRTTLWKRRIKS